MQQQFRVGLKVPLRIGIHLGEVVFDEQEIYGDGVNIAARIESLGVPGTIVLSGELNAAVKSQASILTKSLGYFEFKNVRDPIEVFIVTNEGVRVVQRKELKGKLKDNKRSLAVLPFVNMSPDPDNEYFSDGISEEILNALVRVPGLKVTARTSSFMFKGKNLDVREIGRELGVSYILEGSVRKAGRRLRITTQLVSTIDGFHHFSETYDRTLEDIFAVQDEIASLITNRMRQQLGEAEHADKLVEAPTHNLEAYETYLRGLYFYNQFGDATMMAKAIPYFEKAIALQPDFALPHTRMSMSYLFEAMGMKISWEEAHRKAVRHIERTRELGAESPEAYFAEAIFAIFFKWDWQKGYQALAEGLTHFPHHASLYHGLSSLCYISGDLEGAVRIHAKGLEADPLSIEMILYMAVVYLWKGDFDHAEPYLEQILEMAPNHRVAREYTGWIAAFRGQYGKALDIFGKLEPKVGYRLHRSTCLGWVYFKMGQQEKAEACLQEMLELETRSINFSIDLMTLYTCFGKLDRAFHFLEKSVRNKIGDSMLCRSSIFLAPLRNDPRFARVEELVGKVPEWEVEAYL